MTPAAMAAKVNKMDDKLDQIIKEVKKLRESVEDLESGSDDGMTFLMNSEISGKLDKVIQLLEER